MQPHRLSIPTSGLTAALALSVAASDTCRRQAQATALFRGLGPVQPGPPTPLPLAVEPQPEAAAWVHNLKGFVALLETPGNSANPYNDHRFFAHAPVLRGGWADVPAGYAYQVAPGRADTKAGLGGPVNTALAARFERLLLVAGFDKRYPVLFDRNGLVLDGLHRLQGCAAAGTRFYFLQLDF